VEPVGKTRPGDQVFHYKFSHGAAADIAVADKEDSVHVRARFSHWMASFALQIYAFISGLRVRFGRKSHLPSAKARGGSAWGGGGKHRRGKAHLWAYVAEKGR
jgi:hypothetical protein